MVEVRQEDKQAAARYLVAIVPEMPALAARVMESQTALSRAFARHRIAARRQTLGDAARVAEGYPSTEYADIPVIRGIAYAIRALPESP